MSLTLKIGSLVIKTLAKPIANYIKRNAHEHDRFRKVCVGFAQNLHRIDMRMRLGLLQDSATIERRLAQEAKAVESRRRRAEGPTVKTEAETKAEEKAKERKKDEISEKARKPPRIRPLSEAKAIETGANFISETFMFFIAGGMIVFEQWRSRRKASERREDMAERMEALEKRIEELSGNSDLPSASNPAMALVASSGAGAGSSVKQSKDSEQPKNASSAPSVNSAAKSS